MPGRIEACAYGTDHLPVDNDRQPTPYFGEIARHDARKASP
jgi:hypothetical protein